MSNTEPDTRELREAFRQDIGRILDRHGNAAINAWREQKGFTMVKWDKGTYVLQLEKLFAHHQKQAEIEARYDFARGLWDVAMCTRSKDCGHKHHRVKQYLADYLVDYTATNRMRDEL